MISTSFKIPTPHNFAFWRTVYSHGWCSLPPFRVDKDKSCLYRLCVLNDGSVVDCSLSGLSRQVRVQVRSDTSLSHLQLKELRRQLADCLRLDEDFSEFYRQISRYPRFRWVAKIGAGRLLRAPSVFEDVVKMICTTNCSWALTEAMVGNLTRELGRKLDGKYSFPSPEALAGVTESFFRKKIKAGYRSPYLIEFADRVASKKLDVESWRISNDSTPELFDRIQSVKGIGDYSAANILKLLGRYDYLGLDSWVRTRYYEIHRKGRKVSDKTIERHYAPYGPWRGLFFWLEMTKDWYDQKFPF